ncbi:MAG TPA: phospholipase D-like domain-containing protein [Flavitalea sp.]|nr:phospholipase D-like domain-containing protein [Flavitalea sp.]
MKKSSKKINYNKATDLRFLQSGEEYFTTLLELIHNAQKLIYLQVYTLDPDGTGNMVIQALEEAAKRDVKVYVLVDAYGSKALTTKRIRQMQGAGIHCRRFSPIVFLKFRAGRRLHHKITVVDTQSAIIGGINISDKYRGDDKNLPWLDFGLYVSGPVVVGLQRLCGRMYYPDRIPDSIRRLKKNVQGTGEYPACVVHSDWFRRKNKINYHFKQAIRHAEKDIIVICSYFIPSFRLISLLKSASRKGISIQLYLQGKSDIPIVRNATRFFYRIFFKHDMKIYEFPERILHGKLWMVDDRILSVGSFNFNHLSEYTSIETNMQIAHAQFCEEVKKQLEMIFNDYAEPVPEELYVKKLNRFNRFRLWTSYTVTTVLMKLAFAFTSKSS